MCVNQAGPLFSEVEIHWHRAFREKLAAADIRVLWPGEFFTQREIEAWGTEAPKKIMEKDSAAIDDCDAVVALLDGSQLDDGTVWKIGYAYVIGKPVFGIRTDFRNAGDTSHGCINAMIEGGWVANVIDGLMQSCEYSKN